MESLTNSMLITMLMQSSPGDLEQPNLAMRLPLTSGQNCYNAAIKIELVRLTRQ